MSGPTDAPSALHEALQQRLGHHFANAALLAQALTHRSFSSTHNERLEFLGDSVLNLVVADLLFERLQSLPEGDLSRVRANLVRQETLHHLAEGLELSDVLRLGEGESRSGGARRPSILADALEAVIGAVYLDAGFDAARTLVRRLFADVEIISHCAVAGGVGRIARIAYSHRLDVNQRLGVEVRGNGERSKQRRDIKECAARSHTQTPNPHPTISNPQIIREYLPSHPA
jgi:23S rRNA maturation mini-RNase III